MKAYIEYLTKRLETFKLSVEDISNLYDLLHMVDTPSEIRIDIKKTLETNNMDKWARELRDKIEDIVIWEEVVEHS